MKPEASLHLTGQLPVTAPETGHEDHLLHAYDLLAIQAIRCASSVEELKQINCQYSFDHRKVFDLFTSKLLEVVGGDRELLALCWVDRDDALPSSAHKACLKALIQSSENLFLVYLASFGARNPIDSSCTVVEEMVKRCQQSEDPLGFLFRLDRLFCKNDSSLEEDLSFATDPHPDIDTFGVRHLCRCRARKMIFDAVTSIAPNTGTTS